MKKQKVEKKWTYLEMIPLDLLREFHKCYLASEMNLLWHKLVPLNKIIKLKGTEEEIEKFAVYSASQGYLKILQWLRAKRISWNRWLEEEFEEYYDQLILEEGYDETLKLDLRSDLKNNPKIWEAAALGGHLEILKWCSENNVPWNTATTTNAASQGHLESLQWLRTNGAPWDENVCAMAAYGGHLHVLKWCRKYLAPWDKNTFTYAAKGGHLEVLEWCKHNRAPWNENACAMAAAAAGHLEVLQWCRVNGAPWVTELIVKAAIHAGQLEVLQWCKANVPWNGWNSFELKTTARAAKQQEILMWLEDGMNI